jgi:hypothetical protein
MPTTHVGNCRSCGEMWNNPMMPTWDSLFACIVYTLDRYRILEQFRFEYCKIVPTEETEGHIRIL